ncbi:hypothetical protein OF001_U190049 [Pseudomonas sp. OF001]|nr:hypothetical protein OF001_U190049 [Pseudomonas sp. OF001]
MAIASMTTKQQPQPDSISYS